VDELVSNLGGGRYGSCLQGDWNWGMAYSDCIWKRLRRLGIQSLIETYGRK